MILKAKQRGDGVQLARYLMAMRDNEHVELHEVRGFKGAVRSAEAIRRMVKGGDLAWFVHTSGVVMDKQ